MKYIQFRAPFRFGASLLLLTLVTVSCKKESALEPSNQDENYLVNKDNPNDPVDHAIYQFYTSTDIPCFYNDTVVLKKKDGSAGPPQNFILLSLSYAPFEYDKVSIVLPKLKQQIPAVLDLLRSSVIPKIPKDIFIPSLLFVDSFWNAIPRASLVSADGWDSFHGFNTVAIKLRNVDAMSAEEKKVYMASMLAGIAAKKISTDPAQNAALQNKFYSISRAIAQPLINDDIYNAFLFVAFPFGPPDPTTLGFLHYTNVKFLFNGMPFEIVVASPEDDLRMFLTAAFTYNTQTFTDNYNSSPAVVNKFIAIRKIISEIGFQLPD